MDFVIGLPISTKYQVEDYDFVLVIINRLIKIIHYKLITLTINASRLAEVIFNIIV